MNEKQAYEKLQEALKIIGDIIESGWYSEAEILSEVESHILEE